MNNTTQLNLDLVRRGFLLAKKRRELYVYANLIRLSRAKGWVDKEYFINEMMRISGKSRRTVYRWILMSENMGTILHTGNHNSKIVVCGIKRFEKKFEQNNDKLRTITKIILEDDKVAVNFKEFQKMILEGYAFLKQNQLEYANSSSCPTDFVKTNELKISECEDNCNRIELSCYQGTVGCSLKLLSKFTGYSTASINRLTKDSEKISRTFPLLRGVSYGDGRFTYQDLELMRANPKITWDSVYNKSTKRLIFDVDYKVSDYWLTHIKTKS